MRIEAAAIFETEADLCAAFIAWAESHGVRCFAEWAGWDILIVLPSGHQVGVQAKLRLSDHVMLQALPPAYCDDARAAPDFRAVLVPEDKSRRGIIADRLGLVVFSVSLTASSTDIHDYERKFRGSFAPSFDPRQWTDWNPSKRHELPQTATDSIAGSPCPVTLTPWKLGALRVLAELEVEGRIHSKRMRELRVNPSRWQQGRWLVPHGERGFWIRGEKCPPFDKQHPSAYAAELSKVSA